MDRNDIIVAIRLSDENYALTDFSGYSDDQLKELVAVIAQNKFRGRKLAPHFLEERKFKIGFVKFDREINKFIIGGEPSHPGEKHEFDTEEIFDLICSSTTETEKEVYGFCQ